MIKSHHPINTFNILFVLLVILVACQPKEQQSDELLTNNDSTEQVSSILRAAQDETLAENRGLSATSNPWEVQSIDKQKLAFTNGDTLQTNLYDLDYIGQLHAGDSLVPFLILAGRPCEECDANKAIYFPLASIGSMTSVESMERYPFPGQELFYEDGSLLNEARFFFGEVLPNIQGAIWYQNTKVGEGKYVKNAFLITVKDDKIVGEQMLEEKAPDIALTIEQVNQEKAIEVPGLEYFSEP